MNIQEKIQSLSANMTKKLAQLGKYIIDNMHETTFMNSTQLALNANVSESTVTRFVYFLGYKSFSEFHRQLCKEIRNTNYFPSWQELQSNDSKTDSPFRDVYKLETAIMSETFGQLNPEIFDEIVDVLSSSDKLFLIGGTTHTFMSLYAYNFMSLFRENVHLITSIDLHFVSLVETMTEKSSALIFSYPRYPSEVQQMTALLAEKNVQIIGITDSVLAPIIPYCKRYLITPQKYLVLGEANASVIALVHSILLGMYRKNPVSIKHKLEEYEKNVLTLDMFAVKNYDFTKRMK